MVYDTQHDRQRLTHRHRKRRYAGTDLFVVDIRISPDNVITVEVDSPTAVDIDECAAITRKIEEKFDRDTEDYELEVGSAGITSDFKIRAQYTKN